MSLFQRIVERILGPVRHNAGYTRLDLEPLAIRPAELVRRKEHEALLVQGSSNPVKSIRLPSPIAKVTGGIEHWQFMTSTGHVYALGSNVEGQLGIDMSRPAVGEGFGIRSLVQADDEIYREPARLETLDDGASEATVRDIACGHFTSFFVHTDGRLFAVGSGLLGDGRESFDSRPQPVRLASPTRRIWAWRDLVLLEDDQGRRWVFGVAPLAGAAPRMTKFLRPTALPPDSSLCRLPEGTSEAPMHPIMYETTYPAKTVPPDFSLQPDLAPERIALPPGFARVYRNYNYAVFY